ncbi:hypothetical protein JRQ81_013686, partial [Phrynocephalus forsythii]
MFSRLTKRVWLNKKLTEHTKITWHDKVPNSIVLNRAGIPSMYTLLKQRRLRWLEHVMRMDD